MSNLAGGPAYVVDTTPYPWPYNGDLKAEATAVVVVRPRADVWDAPGAEAVAASAREVSSAVESAGGAVITVTTAPPRGSTPSLDGGSPATELPVGKLVLDAAGVDGFYESGLEPALREGGIERLILVGFGSETCIHSTMRSANDRGFECLFVSDACLAYEPDLTPHTVSQIEMSGGIFGAVGTAAAVVSAFTPRSDA